VAHLVGVEADGFSIVHLHRELAVLVDLLHSPQVAIGNA
jgi:hypothetical protein